MVTIALLVLAGAALLVLETVLPGLIAGLAGLACLIGAVVKAYASFGAQTGHLVALGVLASLVLGIFIYLKYFPDSRLAARFISRQVVGTVGAEQPGLANQEGVALTPLRPSGTALIQGKRVDVVTEGPFLERGVPLRVVAIEGMRVVVRESGPAAPEAGRGIPTTEPRRS